MPARKYLHALLCLVVIGAPVRGTAQERGVSLEETICLLFRSSPAFRLFGAHTRLAQGSRLRSSGAFDITATTAIQGQRTLFANSAGVLTDQGFSDVLLQVGLGAHTRENISWQLSGSLPLISSLDAASTPDQPLASGTLTIPLLKLGRTAAAGAEERAATRHASAASAAQQEAESELAERVAESYWRWAGSYQQLQLTRRLEALALDQLKDVDQLIAQHARAPVERLAFAAAAENATASRVQAEQVMFEQQQLVWDALGLPPPGGLTLASAELPAVPPPLVAAEVIARRAHALASTRPLLKSLEDESAAAEIRANAARIAKRPDLNAVVQAAAMRVESATTKASMPPQFQLGYSGSVALQLSLPLQNRAARGAFEEASATHTQSALGVLMRRNSIDVRIDALSRALATLSHTYQERARAAEQFQRAFEGERVKFRLGTATAMEVVLAEQQYMNASLAMVADRATYAVTLARLLHEAGALSAAIQSRDATAVACALTSSTF